MTIFPWAVFSPIPPIIAATRVPPDRLEPGAETTSPTHSVPSTGETALSATAPVA